MLHNFDLACGKNWDGVVAVIQQYFEVLKVKPLVVHCKSPVGTHLDPSLLKKVKLHWPKDVFQRLPGKGASASRG